MLLQQKEGPISMEQSTKWSALDRSQSHPSACQGGMDPMIQQSGEQVIKTVQDTHEQIIIKDSCDVRVTTTDTQAAVNLQVAIQLAIALVLSVSIADGNQAERITQELFQKIRTKQAIHQKTVVENSRNVNVTTTDTEISVNIQVLLQVLLALVAKLEIL